MTQEGSASCRDEQAILKIPPLCDMNSCRNWPAWWTGCWKGLRLRNFGAPPRKALGIAAMFHLRYKKREAKITLRDKMFAIRRSCLPLLAKAKLQTTSKFPETISFGTDPGWCNRSWGYMGLWLADPEVRPSNLFREGLAYGLGLLLLLCTVRMT